jgi:hypothetical protein
VVARNEEVFVLCESFVNPEDAGAKKCLPVQRIEKPADASSLLARRKHLVQDGVYRWGAVVAMNETEW